MDSTTLSNHQFFRLSSTKLHLDVRFDEKILRGSVEYHLEALKPTNELILDTSHLDIHSVKVDGTSVVYELKPRKEPYGSALHIPYTRGTVCIEFQTTSKCTAVQFVQGDTAEFVFSQCQAIHARSLFPCFDTPAVKCAYEFSCTSKHKCLMSGRSEGEPEVVSSTHKRYFFSQPIPIPSYLVSITSGNLDSAAIGPRSCVHSEPPMLPKCKWEFEHDMEEFIQIAENLVHSYEWESFDVLVLPSSFPYGGMEIPNVTQVTPTLISGDRSQVRVIAHELAHSWSGNLVTNSSWAHFWLNEGWTVYLERRILAGIVEREALKDGLSVEEAKKKALLSFHFNALVGWNSLVDAVKLVNPRFTRLVWDLRDGEDPDDAFSRVPYEKGFNFLFFLQRQIGQAFDGFIKHYFGKFRYKSLDSTEFKDCLYGYFSQDPHLLSVLDNIDWNKWLHGEGLPDDPKFDRTLANDVDQAVSEIHKGKTPAVSHFSSNQIILLLDTLINDGITVETARGLPAAYPELHSSTNTEIYTRWSELLIRNGDFKQDQIVSMYCEWLGSVGRMKYVRPGYRLLRDVFGREYACGVFDRYKDVYHPICRQMVKKDLGV